MRRAWLIFLLLAATVRADWKAVGEGMTPAAVVAQVGPPLIICRNKAQATETWTYDEGGYVMFVDGRVRYWDAPRPERRPAKAPGCFPSDRRPAAAENPRR